MKHGALIAAVCILIGGVGYFLFFSAPAAEAPSDDDTPIIIVDNEESDTDVSPTEPISDKVNSEVTSFEECVAAGNLVMESYPRQCRHEGVSFVEEVKPVVPPAPPTQSPREPIACTMEAKICPDGSAVGRTGPNCEFAPCPGEEPVAWACDDDVKICSDGSTAVRIGPSCEFSPCPVEEDPNDDYFVTCSPESRLVEACIEIYQPVCAQAQVECITAPCDPVEQTFPNACKACMNKRVIGYTPDVCYEF